MAPHGTGPLELANAVHLRHTRTALVLYSAIYATSWVWIDLMAGRTHDLVASVRSSPVLGWNLMMGSWLYLLVIGVSYAIRAQRRVRAEESAASEARLLVQQAQLVALRAQLNPHFLFNALHSVGALPFTAHFETEFSVQPQEHESLLRVQQTGFPDDSVADQFFGACQRGWAATFESIHRFVTDSPHRS